MEFLLEALLESLRLLPFFIMVYFIIETIEVISASSLKNPKFLTGPFSTVLGAGFGLIPLCGFSVVATDLFSQKKIKMGTLLAVYIATSDEAIPLLLLNPEKISSLLPLVLIKFFVAILVGLIVNLISSKIIKKQKFIYLSTNETESTHTHSENEHDREIKDENNVIIKHEEEHKNHHGCCGHNIDVKSKKFNVKEFILHPILHSLKIFAFVLIANIILGGLVQLIGEDNLRNFLASSQGFAPLFSCLIGLIPNCVSSFIITDLFIKGGLTFGACIGGLIVNAGIALLVLFKNHKNIKQNLIILGVLFSTGLIVGYIIQLISIYI